MGAPPSDEHQVPRPFGARDEPSKVIPAHPHSRKWGVGQQGFFGPFDKMTEKNDPEETHELKKPE